jgi:BCCT, betaine/carnitine/choline family transporter
VAYQLPVLDVSSFVVPHCLAFHHCFALKHALFTLDSSIGLASVFGVYVGSLSKGRKLWEVAAHCFLAPVTACMLWVCVWGGVAMRQARQAMELERLGADYYNNSATFLADGSEICYDVPQRDIVVDGETVFKNRLPGVTPVCLFDDDWSDQATINVLHSFRYPHTFGEQGLGPTLTLLYLLGCVVFYITMSDSVSFMVDKFASNGRKNNH